MEKINKEIPLVGYVRNLTDEAVEKRFSEFTLSSEAVDTYRTVFKRDGWDLTRYNANPVVTYAHDDNSSNPDVVLGRGEIFFDGDKMVGRVYYEPEEINPLAEKVRKKVNHGTLRMASVRALPTEAHWGDESRGEEKDVLYFDRSTLFAWSIVPIGSNPDAHVRSAIEEIKSGLAKDIEVKEPKEIKERATIDVYEAQYLINKNSK